MRATLSVESGTAQQDLRLLEEFLSGPELGDVGVERRLAEIPENGMGGLVEVLVVAFGAGGAGTLLAQAISNWLASRYNELQLTLVTPAGKLSLSTRTRADTVVVLRQVEELLRPQAAGPAVDDTPDSPVQPDDRADDQA